MVEVPFPDVHLHFVSLLRAAHWPHRRRALGLPNGLFHTAIQAVWQCNPARFAGCFGPFANVL